MLIRHWRDVAPDIEQPPVDQHYVSLHLGGPKRIERTGDGGRRVLDIDAGAFSIVPAETPFSWRTEGPIEFAHFYFDKTAVSRIVSETFDRDPRDVSLCPALGHRDPLVEALLGAMLTEAGSSGDRDRRYMEELQHLLLHQLIRCSSTLAEGVARARYALAPHRLRRALDFVEGNLASDIGLHDIAAAAGLSAFHFGRAFRQEMGVSPYAYLLQRRILAARKLLTEPGMSLLQISQRCGFNSHSQFSRSFKRGTGVTPQNYRSLH